MVGAWRPFIPAGTSNQTASPSPGPDDSPARTTARASGGKESGMSVHHAVVICAFTPSMTNNVSTSTAAGQGPYVPLEVGDLVQILEQYSTNSAVGSEHKSASKAQWFRGYVFRFSDLGTAPLFGVFPAAYVYFIGGTSASTTLDRPRNAESAVKDASSSGDSTSSAAVASHLGLSLDQGAQPGGGQTHPPLPPFMQPDLETSHGLKEPLVDEISAVLREWYFLLKKHLIHQDYAMFSTIFDLSYQLYQGRRQLLSHTLSPEETIKLRRALVLKLEHGNKLQNLDLIIRHSDRGYVIGEKSVSHVKVFRTYLQQISGTTSQSAATTMAVSNSNNKLTFLNGQVPPSIEKDTPSPDSVRIYSMTFELTACTASICSPGEFAELAFYLFSKQDVRVITEEFVIMIDYNGAPRVLTGSEARLKTMFTHLSAKDLGENSFLVCRIVRVGKLNVSEKDGPTLNIGSLATAFSNMNSVNSAPTNSDGPNRVRRPFGCGVLDMNEVWNHAVSANADAQAEKEYLMKLYIPSNESSFPTIHELIMNKSSGFETSARADHLKVALRILPQSHTTSMELTPDKTRKLGFPDLLIPGHSRNSIYLTLINGEFSTRFTTLTAKNIQVSAQVHLDDGGMIERCISRGLGVWDSQFDSIVYYHSNTPKWMELQCIELDPQIVERAHIFFVFKHVAEKGESTPFAFAFLPLLQGDQTFLQDNIHTLTLYKYDKKLASPSVYLSYQAGPSMSLTSPMQQGADSLNAAADGLTKLPQMKDIFTIKTQLCSTLMTQSLPILNLLHWRHSFQHIPIKVILDEYRKVPKLEVAKFLSGVLNGLFELLDDKNVNVDNQLDNDIFKALVFTLNVVNDPQFLPFGALVEDFVAKWFKSFIAWRPLSQSLVKTLDDPAPQSLKDTIKVWGLIIKFIVRSGLADEKQRRANGTPIDENGPSFLKELDQILKAISNLMSQGTIEAVPAQLLALKHFPNLLPDLALVYGAVELVNVVVKFADSVQNFKPGVLAQKLGFIQTLIRGPLFSDRRSRPGLVAATSRWIMEFLSGNWEVNSARSNTNPMLSSQMIADKASAAHRDRDSIRLCLNVTAELVDRLQKIESRLERSKSGTSNDQADMTARLEDFAKCVECVLDILPKLADIYGEFLEASQRRNHGKPNWTAELANIGMLLVPSRHMPINGVAGKKAIQAKVSNSLILSEIGAVILPLLNLVPARLLLASFSKPTSMSTLLGPTYSGQTSMLLLLNVLQSFTRGDAFPASWVIAYVFVNQMAIKTFQVINRLIQSHSSSGSGTVLLQSDLELVLPEYLRALLQLLNSKWVAVETFNPERKRTMHRLAGDVRGEAGELLRSVWEYLTQQKQLDNSFVPNLFGQFLELTMSPHPKLKQAAVELLFSAIEREYRTYGEATDLENECIDRLDRLVSDGIGDNAYRRFIIEELERHFTNNAKVTISAAVSSVVENSALSPAIRAKPATTADISSGSVALATSFAAFGAKLLKNLDTFLGLCLARRDIPESERFDDERVASSLKLMRFLRETGRSSLVIKYAHEVVRVQLQAGNFVEAALALKLHADLLPWSHEIYVKPVPEYGYEKWETAFERKEQIYLNCIENLEKGDLWERAIVLCAELAAQFEKGWHDYAKYWRALRSQARFAESILQKERFHPSYYRVGFFGRGAPDTLRNKQFIYRGGDWEKLGPFCERIMNKFVGAQLWRGTYSPGEEALASPEFWIQVSSVNPEVDLMRWSHGSFNLLLWEPAFYHLRTSVDINQFYGSLYPEAGPNPVPAESIDYAIQEHDLKGSAPDSIRQKFERLPDPIKSFYRMNEVNFFTFTRPFKRESRVELSKDDPAREFLELWTEKTLMVTEDSFPCLSRRSEIIKTIIVELAPIENAVIAVKSKKRQLEEFERKFGAVLRESPGSPTDPSKRTGPASNVNLFTMALNGAVDAPVNGGIPMYKKAFLGEAYRAAYPEHAGLVDLLEKAINEQAEMVYRCLLIHELVVPAQVRPLHESLIQLFQRNFASEIAMLGLGKPKAMKGNNNTSSSTPAGVKVFDLYRPIGTTSSLAFIPTETKSRRESRATDISAETTLRSIQQRPKTLSGAQIMTVADSDDLSTNATRPVSSGLSFYSVS